MFSEGITRDRGGEWEDSMTATAHRTDDDKMIVFKLFVTKGLVFN